MTIKEKAKEYIALFPKELVANNQGKYAGFINGAEWMLEKVDGWINDNIENYADFGVDTDRLSEDLKKAMEE